MTVFHIHNDETDDDSFVPFPCSPSPLSNGKPLKSSLKHNSLPRLSNHQRARSAPSSISSLKNVHFADEKDSLESVRLFNRSAKPASLSSLNLDDTETETEIDSYFPPFQPSFQLDPESTSQIPSPAISPYANIHLESVLISSSSPGRSPFLTGSLIVRNIAYEKHVAVRFTVDDWQTTSEVLARHVVSLPALPPHFAPRTVGDAVAVIARANKNDAAAPWDRFSFTIRLEDYAFKLHEKVLWFVVRYATGSTAPGAGEWWDNNDGRNYRVGFKLLDPVPAKRAITLSAPPHLPPNRFPTPPNTTHSLSPTNASTAPPSLSARLGKLNLLNYAAPARSPPTSTPAKADDDEHTPIQSPLPARTIVGGQPATGFGYMNLHWPWGSTGAPAPEHEPYTVHIKHQDDDDDGGRKDAPARAATPPALSPATSGSESESDSLSSLSSVSPRATPRPRRYLAPPASFAASRPHQPTLRLPPPRRPFSPRPSAPTSPPVKERPRSPAGAQAGRGHGEEEGARDGGREGVAGAVAPAETGLDTDTDPDSVYKALVRQWCFAQGPPPAVGGSGGLVVR